MTTIQVSIEELMLAKLDRAANEMAMTRADFVHDALEAVLNKIEVRSWEESFLKKEESSDRKISCLEQRDREGYERLPATPEEFGDWDKVRDWGPE